MLSQIKNINNTHNNVITDDKNKKSNNLELFNLSKPCAQTNNICDSNNAVSSELLESTNISNYSDKSRVTKPNVTNNSELFNYSNENNTINLQNSQQLSDYNQDKSSTTNSSPFQKQEILFKNNRKSALSEVLTNSTELPRIFNQTLFFDNRKTSQ